MPSYDPSEGTVLISYYRQTAQEHEYENNSSGGQILAASETPQDLLERVVTTLFSVEQAWRIDHILMVAELAGMQGVIDESASKTVNLPEQTTVRDVQDIFLASYHYGLKNISVYRDQTKVGQPEML